MSRKVVSEFRGISSVVKLKNDVTHSDRMFPKSEETILCLCSGLPINEKVTKGWRHFVLEII